MISLLINKSVHKKFRPGTIMTRTVDAADLVWSDGKLTFEGIVVKGDKQYPNGRKLTLFIDPVYDVQASPNADIFLTFTMDGVAFDGTDNSISAPGTGGTVSHVNKVKLKRKKAPHGLTLHLLMLGGATFADDYTLPAGVTHGTITDDGTYWIVPVTITATGNKTVNVVTVV